MAKKIAYITMAICFIWLAQSQAVNISSSTERSLTQRQVKALEINGHTFKQVIDRALAREVERARQKLINKIDSRLSIEELDTIVTESDPNGG